MPKKPRVPDPAAVFRCDKCGQSIGGKGYYGPESMCHLSKPKGPAIHGGRRRLVADRQGPVTALCRQTLACLGDRFADLGTGDLARPTGGQKRACYELGGVSGGVTNSHFVDSSLGVRQLPPQPTTQPSFGAAFLLRAPRGPLLSHRVAARSSFSGRLRMRSLPFHRGQYSPFDRRVIVEDELLDRARPRVAVLRGLDERR